MAITPVQDLISSALSPAQTKVASATATIANTTTNTTQAEASSSSSTSSSSPLLATASLQNASVGLAQLSSLLEEAQSGTQQIGSVLQQLQNLAGVAQNGGPPSALAALDGEFQQLITQLNQIAAGTSFGGASLLDGSLSGQGADTTTGTSLTIPNLTSQGLFGGTSPNLLNVVSATSASATVASAQNLVSGANANIGATQAEVSFTSANVDTALANNSAATSVLSDNDLTDGASSDLLAGLLSNTATTTSAQTSNLPVTLLNLLQE